MSKKTVTITIDETGNSSLDLASFAGKGCSKVAEDFRGRDKVKLSRNKLEYTAQEPVQQKAQQ